MMLEIDIPQFIHFFVSSISLLVYLNSLALFHGMSPASTDLALNLPYLTFLNMLLILDFFFLGNPLPQKSLLSAREIILGKLLDFALGKLLKVLESKSS